VELAILKWMCYVFARSVNTSLTTDIVFMTPFTDLNETEITDYPALRALGDDKMANLIGYLNGTTGGGSHSSGASQPTVSTLGVLFSALSIVALITM